jgi:hypothetical protein
MSLQSVLYFALLNNSPVPCNPKSGHDVPLTRKANKTSGMIFFPREKGRVALEEDSILCLSVSLVYLWIFRRYAAWIFGSHCPGIL